MRFVRFVAVAMLVACGGNIEEDAIAGTYVGTATNGTFTIDAAVHVLVDGTKLVGTITYTPVTNGDGACGALSGCSQQQQMFGTRQ